MRLAPDAPAGTRVSRDGLALTGTTLAAGVPVDPGEHVIRTELPDGRATEARVWIRGRRAAVDRRAAPRRDRDACSPSAPPAPVASSPPAPASPSAPPPSHAGWTYAAAGVGAAAVVVAGITGGIALGQKLIRVPVCDDAGVCATQRGVDAGNEARAMANVETGALVVGGVALAAAIVLWLTEPHARDGVPAAITSVGARGASVAW